MLPTDSNKTIYSHLIEVEIVSRLFGGPFWGGGVGFIIKGVKIESLKKVWKLNCAP